MNFLKIVGKIGAVAAGGAALFLAGKSGLGESLFTGDKNSVDTDDLEQGLQPTEPETEMTETETVEEVAEETEASD